MTRGRLLAALASLLLACLISQGAAAEDCPQRPAQAGPIAPSANSFRELEERLWRDLDEEAGEGSITEILHRLDQIRNFEALGEILVSIPEGRRPQRILYAASGDHMAPLVAPLLDPTRRPYFFTFTEIDPSAEKGIGEFLSLLERTGIAAGVKAGPPLSGGTGERVWRFAMGSHRVLLRLEVSPPDKAPMPVQPYRAELLRGVDLVISHDWSGDPLENLRLIHGLLMASRDAGLETPPPCVMEDLETHPYPVDLALFRPAARSSKPYGHRASRPIPQAPSHKNEQGAALFGGAVLLSFDLPWWRTLPAPALEGVFDFLLLNAFDSERQNVLEGGPDPLLPPALLDWFTGFGARTIAGADLRGDPKARQRAIEAAAALHRVLPRAPRERWACRMLLYRSLLEVKSRGGETAPLLPSAKLKRRPSTGAFPSPEMERLTAQAQARLADYEKARTREGAEAGALLKSESGAELARLAALCPCPREPSAPGNAASWGDLYRKVSAFLEHTPE